MYRNVIKSFGEKLMSDKTLSENIELCNTVKNILKGSGRLLYSGYPQFSSMIPLDSLFHGCISFFPSCIVGKEDLFPFFLCHAQSIHPLVGPAKKLLDTSNLRSPASWYATSTSAMQCSLKGDSYDGKESMMLHTFSGFLKPVLSQGGSCIMQDPQTLEKLTKPCITSTRQGRPYIVLH